MEIKKQNINYFFWKYYTSYSNIWKILPELMDREVMLIDKSFFIKHYNNVRHIRTQNFQSIQTQIIGRIKNNNLPYNIYHSLARYKYKAWRGYPLMSQLSCEEIKNWNMEAWKYIIAYDFFIDLDCPKEKYINICFDDAKRIQKDLQKKGFENTKLRFSGMGFHVIVPYDDFVRIEGLFSLNPNDDNNIYKVMNSFQQLYYNTLSELVDTGLCDSRRVVKCLHSLVYNPKKSKHIFIVKDYTDKDTFDIKDVIML